LKAFGRLNINSDTSPDSFDLHPESVDNRGRSIFSEHGGHYRDSIVRAEFSALDTWSKRWQGELGREVNLASFSDTGPEEESAFKESDWIVQKPR